MGYCEKSLSMSLRFLGEGRIRAGGEDSTGGGHYLKCSAHPAGPLVPWFLVLVSSRGFGYRSRAPGRKLLGPKS